MGLRSTSNSNDGLEAVYKDRVVPLKDLKIIADMYAVNIVDTSHKVRNNNLSWAEGRKNIDDAEKTIAEKWIAYLATTLVAEEIQIIEEAKPLMAKADASVAKLKTVMNKENREDLAQYTINDLYPAIDPISGKFSELVDIQLKVAKEDYDRAESEYRSTRKLSIAAMTGGLILGIGFGAIIAKSIGVTINSLTFESNRLCKAATEGKLTTRGDVNAVPLEFQGIIQGINTLFDSIVTIISNLPFPAIAMDKELKVVWANESALTMLHSTNEDITGKQCFDLIQAGDCQTENCACAKAINQGQIFSNETHACPHGTDMEVTYYGVPIKDINNNVSSVIEMIIDQTKIKEANIAAIEVNAFQQTENNKMIDAMAQMSNGDLTFRLECEPADRFTVATKKRYDEIYAALAQGTGALATAIGTIAVNARQVASATAQTSSAISMISDGSQNQLHAIAQVATAIKQTSTSILDVVRNTEEASQLAKESVAIVQDGQNRMSEMIQIVNAIAVGSEKINKITEIIEKIANKTNLLSLNAAIEAARAGEHGRGFAVVAEEVGKLAANAAESTREISALVEQAVKEANHAVAAVSKVNEGMGKIVEGSSQTDAMLLRISAALEQQSSAVQEINANVSGLSKVAESNAAAAEEITATVFELAKITDDTRQQAERFKI